MSKFLYANIVDDLEAKIKKGDLIDGTKLPSERLMAEKYNVSRNVVREAFKVMAERVWLKYILAKVLMYLFQRKM